MICVEYGLAHILTSEKLLSSKKNFKSTQNVCREIELNNVDLIGTYSTLLLTKQTTERLNKVGDSFYPNNVVKGK